MSAKTILIVDDEPVNLTLLTSLLRPEYLVRAASSGEAALRAAVSEPPAGSAAAGRDDARDGWLCRTCATAREPGHA